MKTNKMYSVLLGLLLMVPGQAFCSEPLIQGSSKPSWFSMPTMPATSEWVTNLVNKVKSLSDDAKKYLLYGALGTFLGYLGYKGYKTYSSANVVPIFMEGRKLLPPDSANLNSTANCSNMAYILDWYSFESGDEYKEKAFRHYVCPVFKRFEDQLKTQDQWEKLLSDIKQKADFIQVTDNYLTSGLKLYDLMRKTCSKDKMQEVMSPLKDLLAPYGEQDIEVKKILDRPIGK